MLSIMALHYCEFLTTLSEVSRGMASYNILYYMLSPFFTFICLLVTDSFEHVAFTCYYYCNKELETQEYFQS